MLVAINHTIWRGASFSPDRDGELNMPSPLGKVHLIFNISTKCQETGEFLSLKKILSHGFGGKIEMRPGANYTLVFPRTELYTQELS